MKLCCPRGTVIAAVVCLFCNMLRDIPKTAAEEITRDYAPGGQSFFSRICLVVMGW